MEPKVQSRVPSLEALQALQSQITAITEASITDDRPALTMDLDETVALITVSVTAAALIMGSVATVVLMTMDTAEAIAGILEVTVLGYRPAADLAAVDAGPAFATSPRQSA